MPRYQHQPERPFLTKKSKNFPPMFWDCDCRCPPWSCFLKVEFFSVTCAGLWNTNMAYSNWQNFRPSWRYYKCNNGQFHFMIRNLSCSCWGRNAWSWVNFRVHKKSKRRICVYELCTCWEEWQDCISNFLQTEQLHYDWFDKLFELTLSELRFDFP